MFITLHSAIGITAGLALFRGNWPAALLLGWATHYLFDAVPHGDEADESLRQDRRQALRQAALMGSIDLTLLCAMVTAVSLRSGFSPTVVAAAVGSSLPDIMWGLAAVAGRPDSLGVFARIHGAAHNPLNILIPFWLGLGLQVVAASALWFRLML